MVARSQRIRYLLGLCSQAEREQIESEYFEDDHAFQEMLTAENDLIDAYARGELTRDERRRFEKHFLTSLRGSDRVQFARAFAGAVSSVRTLETKPRATLLDVFMPPQRWLGALRSAAVAAVVILVAVLSWQLLERRRISNELRVEYSELSKQIESLPPSTDADRTRSAESTEPENLRAPSIKSRKRAGSTTLTQQANRAAIPKVNNDRWWTGEVGPEHTGQSRLANDDSSTRVVGPAIAQLPLDYRNVPGWMSLSPKLVARFSLLPRSRTGWDGNTFTLARSVTFVVFRLSLETAAQHPEYRITFLKGDGRPALPVRTLQFKPARDSNSIDSFWIPTYYLSPGIYELYLTGKDSSGSFVRVAEYCFIVIRGSENGRSRFGPTHR